MSESPAFQESRGWRVLTAQYVLRVGHRLWLWALRCSGHLLRWCTRSPRGSWAGLGWLTDSETHSLSSLVSSFLQPPTGRMTGGLCRSKMSCLLCRPTFSFLSFLGSPGRPTAQGQGPSATFSPSCPVAFPRTSLFGVWWVGGRCSVSLWEPSMLSGELPAN